MIIQEDSRQQKGKHELKRNAMLEAGHQIFRSKVIVGDYCKPPTVAVDTKENVSEIAQNIGGGREEHQRFIRELKLARDIGCQLYVLVENVHGYTCVNDIERWRNPRTDYSPDCIQGPRLAKAMRTIEERYGCVFMFCAPEEAADIIVDLLR